MANGRGGGDGDLEAWLSATEHVERYREQLDLRLLAGEKLVADPPTMVQWEIDMIAPIEALARHARLTAQARSLSTVRRRLVYRFFDARGRILLDSVEADFDVIRWLRSRAEAAQISEGLSDAPREAFPKRL